MGRGMMGRGRKLLLGALRRGRTSARADSPARTRFARVRRAHSAACSSLPMANSDQSPSSAYLRPRAPLLRPSLHLQPSCRLRVLPLFSPFPCPLTTVRGDVLRASGGGAHAISATSPSTPVLDTVGVPRVSISCPFLLGAVLILADGAAGNVRGPGWERPSLSPLPPLSSPSGLPSSMSRLALAPSPSPSAGRDARHAQR